MNNEEIKEIEIKQRKLKTVIDIEKLAFSGAAAEVNKKNILEYTHNEKNKLILDIILSLNINKFDDLFIEDGSISRTAIESHINSIKNYNNESVLGTLYNEFVRAVATYQIDDLIGYDILNNYLNLIKTADICYAEIDFEECKKI